MRPAAFAFTSLRPGSYRIVETQPAGYLDGTDTLGTQGGSARERSLRFRVARRCDDHVAAGTSSANCCPLACPGWSTRDLNNNGTQQPGETGISGVSVRLTGTDDRGNSVDITVTTDGSGTFNFREPATGHVYVERIAARRVPRRPRHGGLPRWDTRQRRHHRFHARLREPMGRAICSANSRRPASPATSTKISTKMPPSTRAKAGSAT